MARVLIYEHILGGGLFTHRAQETLALMLEAWAMLQAVVEDFAALPDTEVEFLWDRNVPRSPPCPGPNAQPLEIASPEESLQVLVCRARSADAVLIIAPEIGSALEKLVQQVEGLGTLLLGPPASMIRVASDKQATALHLEQAGVRVPPGQVLQPGEPLPEKFPLPAVLKPLDGAGALGIRRVSDRDWVPSVVQAPLRLEPWLEGTAASVAILSGGAEPVLCPPCGQTIRWNHSAHYEGGYYPLPQPLGQRAWQLASQVAEAFPQARGYWGVDLLLGTDPEGSQDYVVEVNPRLTTSYVVLREACRGSLAQAIWDAALGRPAQVEFDSQARCFTSQGLVVPG